jgi:hypothetical protein
MAEPTEAKENPVEKFVDYVQNAFEIIQLNTEQIDRTAKDEGAFIMGLVIIALAGIASAIGTFNFPGLVFNPVLMVVAAFLVAGLLHLLATMLFKGEGDFLEFFRPVSHTYILYWVTVVPFLGWLLAPLAGLWGMVVTVLIVERVYNLDRAKAIATVAIVVGAFMLLFIIFGGMLAVFAVMMMRAAS